MPITHQDVLHVARLARLRLADDEVERFTSQLNSILSHVEELATVPTAGIEAVGGAAEGAAPLRDDGRSIEGLSAEMAGIAPAWRDGFFLVPRLAALDSGSPGAPAAAEPHGDPGHTSQGGGGGA